MSAFGTMVIALAGADSIVGAAPAVTVTASSARGWTEMTTGPDSGSAATGNGFMYRPPGRTTSTSKGGAGLGCQVNRPSASVR